MAQEQSQRLKLITDSVIQEPEVITEQSNNNEKPVHKIKAPYLVAEVENENGRTYDYNVMKEAVKEYHENYIKKNIAIGELSHPESPVPDYERACHKILSLDEDDNKRWIGTSQILTGTPKGDLLKGLLDNNVRIGFSSRSLGNINENSRVSDMSLRAIDVVSEQSTDECFVDGILENKEFIISSHGDVYEARFEEFENDISNLSSKTDEKNEQLVQAVEKILRSL